MTDTPTTPDPTTSNGELEELERRVESAERQRDEYLNLLRQTQADFENARQRATRERDAERRYFIGPLVADLLPALDNLERALDAARQSGDGGPLAQGVALVQSQLLDALKRYGVTRVESLGQPFDPNLHQAVMQQPSADHPANTIVHVLEQGFLIHDRVLRPARVIVSTTPPTT